MAMAPEGKSFEDLQKQKLLLEMELIEEQTNELRMKRANRKRQRTEQEKTLSDGRAFAERVQCNCTHRKGGKGDDLANNHGSDPNCAVADQQMPNGHVWRMCMRCFALWVPGDTARSHPTGISYEKAMSWPTDNSPCGSVQFRVPERREAPERREVEAKKNVNAE